MLKDIKAVFFDMDDTLINFGGVTKIAWELTCKKMVNKIPEIDIDVGQLVDQILIRNEEYWSEENRPKGNTDFKKARYDVLSRVFNDLNISNERAIDFLIDHYSDNKEKAIHVFPNVYETLNKLIEMDYKLVLITNGDGSRQREKIARFDLEKYFSLILIEGEQGFGKPDSRVYQKAIEFCEVLPHEACMVGDNYLWEVEKPIKLGMKGVWVNTENKSFPDTYSLEPHLVVRNVDELLKTLKKD